ncbi:hypothetical protein [Streptomyces flavalbus]|uniref:Phospholipid carrier-dependent glycosyltransferase n=1 Tax=Streptomyces flavalbus TaxID=2665155 RepID=A0ABW2WGI4_9ACTN
MLRALSHHPGARRPAALFALFGGALTLRLTAVRQAYDIHVDECYYVAISQSLADDGEPAFEGGYFALHPPALFALLAGVLRATHGPPDLADAVLALRPVIAVIGALSVTALTALLLRTVRPSVAWATGLLLALDPFLNRFDSRVFLETPTMAAAALGMLVLTRAAGRPGGARGAGCAAGLLFAVSLTTKDWYVLATLLPVVVLAVLSRGAVRRTYLTAAAVAAGGYGGYLAATIATGHWADWRSQRFHGLRRAAGLDRLTGFGSPDNTAVLSGRLHARLGDLGVSYALLALGACATCWLVWQRLNRPRLFTRRPGRTVVTVWAACSLPTPLYAALLGTVEEQMFYPALLVCALALAVTADLLLPARPRRHPGSRTRPRHRRTVCLGAVCALTTAALCADTVVWSRTHGRHDDALRRTISWIDARVGQDETVRATDDTLAVLLPEARPPDWDNGRTHYKSPRLPDTDYVLVTRELVRQGYAFIDPALRTELRRRARLVHTETGPTAGAVEVYDTRRLAGRTVQQVR